MLHRWRFRFLRVWLAAVLAMAVAMPVAGQGVGRKLALVVGNEAYAHLPLLTTPAADAGAVAKALRDLGFEVTLLTDVGPEVFQAVLGTFAKQAGSADTVLFYYAGHAFQKGGVNHLVPVGATLQGAAAVDAETWRLDDIAAQLRGAGQLLLFLDACRDNPVGGVADAAGLAQYDGGAGSFVAFASAPGSVAADRQQGSANSPFATALLAHLAVPGQSISDLMIAVRNDVAAATKGQQTPWEQSSLRQQFYFVPAGAEPALPEFEMAQGNTLVGPPGGVTLAKAPPITVIGQVSGGGLRLAALTSATRSLSVLQGVTGAGARIAGVDPGGTPMPPLPENLPLAVQGELKRIGCYGLPVDGDWGNGSRNAMRAYYKAKKQNPGAVEPTEAVYRALLAEPPKTCSAAAVAEKKPAKATSSSKKPASTAKPAEPATAPEKKGVKCRFMVIAVVCS